MDFMAMEKRRVDTLVNRDTATCYRERSGVVAVADDWAPCTINSNMCCGVGDQCMGLTNFCYSPNNNSNHITYYTAGCTDKTFDNPACNSHCGNETWPAVKWQSDKNQWACCGDGNLGQPSCINTTNELFSGPSQQSLDDWRNNMSSAQHALKLAGGVIAAIVIACVVILGLGCFCLWRCCFSRAARDKRHRGKFVPLGGINRNVGADQVWNADSHEHDLHQGPAGAYGYGGQGAAPYNPPHQQGPQYTVANFR